LAFCQNQRLDSLYSALLAYERKDTVQVNLILSICDLEYTLAPQKNKTLAEEALKISEEINFEKGIGFATRYIGLYYWVMGDFESANYYAYKTLRIFERFALAEGLSESYQLLGIISVAENDFDKGKLFFTKALEISIKANQQRGIGYGYNSLGAMYCTLKRYDLALEFLFKALEIRTKMHDEEGLSQTYNNLGVVYKTENKIAKALEYHEKNRVIIEKSNNRFRMAILYNNLGELYSLSRNPDKAKSYYLKAIEAAKQIRNKVILKEVYSGLSQLEKDRGRFKDALEYKNLTVLYKDSIYTQEKAKQIAEIQTRYETEKKDQTIQLLERDNQIQRLWTNVLIASTVLLLVLSIAIYLLQQSRERKNRLILNLKIDYLTTQNKEMSEKYIHSLSKGDTHYVESSDSRMLKKIIEVIESNMSDTSFGVVQLSKEMGMSRASMNRKIKALTGFPPIELIRNIRLRKAAKLLLNQTDSVSQIGFIVGFEDHSYFSKLFKKQFGMTPSEYMQSRVPMN